MLFSSYSFVLLFLPITLGIFFLIAKSSHRLAILWLVTASIVFYAFHNPKFVLLLLASVVFNFGVGYSLCHSRTERSKRILLIVAIIANLMLLVYFKYTNFFISTVNTVMGLNLPLIDLILPLGISFFTFTQMAFLIDAYRGTTKEYFFEHYLLFATYFPYLTAGPVLHHKQMMPQFSLSSTYRINSEKITLGLSFFVIGLAKKVLLADSLAEYSNPIFEQAKSVSMLPFMVGWTGALTYTMQLYFDFSGYSDMAIGISKMFGIELPINFSSPYKASNMIDFWRRWHMTLSQFLRDYLYIPLGGNRRGEARKYFNIMVTMILGGLWHGASWTFVVWGTLHGFYLLMNHAWNSLKQKTNIHFKYVAVKIWMLISSRILTFLLVVIAWVFFRSETCSAALVIIKSMVDYNELLTMYQSGLCFSIIFRGIMIPPDSQFYLFGLVFITFFIVFLLPNTDTFIKYFQDKIGSEKKFIVMGSLISICFLLLAINASRGSSDFIYFNF